MLFVEVKFSTSIESITVVRHSQAIFHFKMSADCALLLHHSEDNLVLVSSRAGRLWHPAHGKWAEALTSASSNCGKTCSATLPINHVYVHLPNVASTKWAHKQANSIALDFSMTPICVPAKWIRCTWSQKLLELCSVCLMLSVTLLQHKCQKDNMRV